MGSDREVERLQRVYREYREDHATHDRWSPTNRGNQAISRERKRFLAQMLHEVGTFPLTGLRILDVGCGSGRVLADLTSWGASSDDLYGIDLLAERVEEARRQFPAIHFSEANAEALDFPDTSFDLVLLFAVFTSILDPTMAQQVASEVGRVLKPGGGIVWYDFRYENPRNVHVRGLSKKNIKELFSGFDARFQTVTLLPPLARRLGKGTPFLYPILSILPFLRTHYLGLLVKPL